MTLPSRTQSELRAGMTKGAPSGLMEVVLNRSSPESEWKNSTTPMPARAAASAVFDVEVG